KRQQHGAVRKKLSTYGLQLREKQKVKRIYGVQERQFRRYFSIATRFRGASGTVLLQLLERRLDNIVYRLGFATSRRAARQLVAHGHIQVNGRRVDIPSYLVRPGQEITISSKKLQNLYVQRALKLAETQGRSPWLEFDADKVAGKLVRIPERHEIPLDVQEQLIVELYSK
ncbi:MAG: 30S ribosomal protein S4, partial [Candidatus Sumerlaeia bacterium]|nr:30S ribosomal protein S4 [Candidatus Sumerlaeia bacterium]